MKAWNKWETTALQVWNMWEQLCPDEVNGLPTRFDRLRLRFDPSRDKVKHLISKYGNTHMVEYANIGISEYTEYSYRSHISVRVQTFSCGSRTDADPTLSPRWAPAEFQCCAPAERCILTLPHIG
jgi:hypothetical protein